MVDGSEGAAWTFLTNHAHVLMCIAADPGIRARDIAVAVGITERAAQRIIADLEDGGYLSHERVGRRNRYQLHAEMGMRHPMDAGRSVAVLLDLLTAPTPTLSRRAKR